MIAGFRKPKRNFRKKVSVNDDDDDAVIENDKGKIPFLEHSINNVSDVTVSLKKAEKKPNEKSKEKQKGSKSGSKSAGLLSFEDEIEEGEEFQLKKTKESRKLMQKIKDEKKKKKVIKIEANTTNDFTEDISKGLDNETFAEVRSPQEDENEIAVVDDDESDDEDEAGFSNIHSDLSTGIIPDAATIFALKKQRERARTLGTGADFVPLQTTTKYKDASKSSKGRLVREEDDDSDEERMEFKGSQKKAFPALERRKEVAKALEDAHDDIDTHKDEDEEINIWEQQQIKKGASIPASQNEPKYGPAMPPAYGQPVADANFQNIYSGTPVFGAQGPMMYGFPVQSMPSMAPQGSNIVTVDMVSQRIRERLESIQQVHRAHVLEQEKHKTDVENYKSSTKSLEIKSHDVSDRFKFYQEMSGYVRDLLDCLNEKVPTINELESSMLQLWKQKSHKYCQRRIDDTKDEDSQITGKIPKKATSVGTDEFGRDRSTYEETARQRRIAEREGRRNRRRKNRTRDTQHHEGLSSDDEELDSEIARFNADKERILNQRPAIFEDVISDFSSIDEIKSRFEEWKFGFNDTYKEAYIHLCLPKLFAPFLRLEMLEWNPLQVDNKDFEDSVWFQSLVMYAHHDGQVTVDDEDTKLVPHIIEKVLIPRLTELVKFVWDPLSQKQTNLLIMLMQRLGDDYPTLQKQSKNTETLISEVINKLKHTIDTEMYIPLYPKGLLQNRTSGASAFLDRQFWCGYKLFRNIMSWKDLISMKVIQELGLDSVLNRYLVVALQQMSNYQECLDKCKEVISILPKCLLDGSDNVPRNLQPFARYLNSLAANIFKSSLGYSDIEKKKAKLMIKKCISLLMHLQAFDMARTVAKEFKIETAKDT